MKINNQKFEFCIRKNKITNKNEYFIKPVFEWWHTASFDNLKQVKKFFKLFKIKIIKTQSKGQGFKSFLIDKIFIEEPYFWEMAQVPTKAKKIKALSNGSLVDCYYTINKRIVKIYRPNPNAKAVYQPLDIYEHISYNLANGTF